MPRTKERTSEGNGWGPAAVPKRYAVWSTLATQSRSASLMASLRVLEPLATGTTSAPSSRIRATFSACRSVSTSPMYTTQSRSRYAAAVADATPCWPAPVSAMTRDLPIRRVSSAWPSTLRILCAPVWLRSSRLSRMRAPATSDSRVASYSRLGVPAYSRSRRSNSAVNSGSAIAACQASVSSSRAAISASGMNLPPKRPKWPALSGMGPVGIGLVIAPPPPREPQRRPPR
jgi:hypothetical protein